MLSNIFLWLQGASAAVQAGWTYIGQLILDGVGFAGQALQAGLQWAVNIAMILVDQAKAEIWPVIHDVQYGLSQAGVALGQLGHLIQYVEQEALQLLGVTSERARQYHLARLAANPLGVLSEGPTVVYQAGGVPSLPDPNLAAPGGAAAALLAEFNGYRTDPTHAVRAAVDGFVADLGAVRQRRPPTLAAYAVHAEDVPGYTPAPPAAGADPGARGQLTDDDRRLVTSTTS